MSPTTSRDEWLKYAHLFERLELPAKATLLAEGQVARHTYLLEKGCVRIWFNNGGKDITLDFFFEGEGVSSIESFRTGRPSAYALESLEPCVIHRIAKEDFRHMLASAPLIRSDIEEVTFRMLFRYQSLFLSRIKDTPEQRYRELLERRPEILQRVPQHYIASYLGITPVSLSRIRNKR